MQIFLTCQQLNGNLSWFGMSKQKKKIIFSNKNIKEDYICKVGESEGVLLREAAAHKCGKGEQMVGAVIL